MGVHNLNDWTYVIHWADMTKALEKVKKKNCGIGNIIVLAKTGPLFEVTERFSTFLFYFSMPRLLEFCPCWEVLVTACYTWKPSLRRPVTSCFLQVSMMLSQTRKVTICKSYAKNKYHMGVPSDEIIAWAWAGQSRRCARYRGLNVFNSGVCLEPH